MPTESAAAILGWVARAKMIAAKSYHGTADVVSCEFRLEKNHTIWK